MSDSHKSAGEMNVLKHLALNLYYHIRLNVIKSRVTFLVDTLAYIL